jgi:choline-sulfatase
LGALLRRLNAAVAIVAVCASCAGCAGPSSRPDPPRATPRGVVVITIDTLRADRLPPYGYRGVDTPAITRLAREGVTFQWAFTPVPLTLPAHSSLFTGQLPFRHGVRDNGGFHLGEQTPTLASTLAAAGYKTAAFVSAFVLDGRWGLARGFDEYFDRFAVSARDLAAMARVQRTGEETWIEAQRWLERQADGRFFLWLHLFDPHTPYEPPEPYRTRYAGRLYDGEIAYSDAIVGRVIRLLEERGALDETLVLLLSDHGEGLGDHGEDEHGLFAYDSTLRVPWIVRMPGGAGAGRVVDRPVSLVDVMPTVLGVLGVPPPPSLDGADLSRLLTTDAAVPRDELYAETYYPRLQYDWNELLVVRNERYKLIRAPRPELYEYRADVGESRNIAAENAPIVARLNQILDRMAADGVAPPRATAVDADTARRLSALGYTAGATPAPHPGPRPDPKDKAGVYRDLARARELLAGNAGAAGVAALQRIVLDDPDLEPARRLLRDYWLSRRAFTDGIAFFGTAAARHPGTAPFMIEVGTFERARGRQDRALIAFERALAIAPDSVDALVAAADLHRDAGRHARSLDLLNKAASISPEPATRLRLADALIRSGRIEDADAVVTASLAADSHVAGAHYLRAQIAERQGDRSRAEREYRLELAVAPWEYRARFNLALLVGARKDFREQAALLEAIPPIAPEFREVFFYIAKALLDAGDPARRGDAVAAAQRGLQLAPESPAAPLGHYVLADVYRLQGRPAEAERHFRLGRELEQRAAPKR